MSSTQQMSSTVNGSTALAPNKVAELVRQLAVTQYEAQQLRQQMELMENENKSFRNALSQRQNENRLDKNAHNGQFYHRQEREQNQQEEQQQQQQQQRSDNRGPRETASTNVSMNDNNRIEKPRFIDRLLHSPGKKHLSPLQRQQQQEEQQEQERFDSRIKYKSPLRSSRKTTEDFPNMCTEGVEVHASSSSLDDSYWKKKYLKLKRLHAKSLMERDLQLSEVQQLVFQIHEEHDEMRHSHAQDRLRQQLEQESKFREMLEKRAKILEDELIEWRQRFLRFIEDPGVARYRLVAQEIPASPNNITDIGRPHYPEGLNQTIPSFTLADGVVHSVIDTGSSSQNVSPSLPSHQCNMAGINNINNTNNNNSDNGLDLGQRRRQHLNVRANIFAGETWNYGVPHKVLSTVNSLSAAIQVSPTTTTATSQTEMCSRRSIGIQVDAGDDDTVVDDIQKKTRKIDWVQCARKSTIAYQDRNTMDLQSCLLRDTRNGSMSLKNPQQIPAEDFKGHFYYSVNEEQSSDRGFETSPMPPVGYQLNGRRSSRSFPIYSESTGITRSTFSEPLGFIPGDDQMERERLDEDIRKHDQLLEAVAKLQRQAQRAAKTPSF
ncbi:uncharacterized protein TM35_000281130 [Trypanosoma theileri]|uniref:Uncharacterized protein n=1 Tax=Trypanosoma theileri TaxID=67003 RepID=A0A1X0NNX6_9TRYP|nr:uncharacterized protein TM35_000281130 [Trypanosoma theileri]ORC86397.1 hypothetical protein TM35_000281130 [Trypanosoma theileri]